MTPVSFLPSVPFFGLAGDLDVLEKTIIKGKNKTSCRGFYQQT